jgi:glycosyltransferase involved in cell wall biosynthesis
MNTLKQRFRKDILIISYLDYPFPAGLSNRITGLANVLASNGFKVTILAPMLRGDFSVPLIENFKNITIERVNLRKLALKDCSNLGPKALGLLTFSIIASFRAIAYYIRTRSLIQYQTIYSAAPALLLRLLFHAKVLGDDIVLGHTILDSLLLKSTGIILTPSLKTYSFARQIGVPTLYVPNGIKASSNSNQIHKIKTRLTFVGVLSYRQNLIAITRIIELAQSLYDENVSFEFCIVGGPLNYVNNLFSHPIVKKGKVRFLGSISAAKLDQVYASSFIGLLPFFDDTPLEGGQRTKALEYFAKGLLVISGPQGIKGIEGLIPGEHYLLVDSFNSMQATLKECLTYPEKYIPMASKGAEHAAMYYSWDTLTKHYIDFVLR